MGGNLSARARYGALPFVLAVWLLVAPKASALSFAYVANSAAGKITAFRIDGATGALLSVPGSPFSAGMWPCAIATSQSGRHAYVLNAASGTVSAYAIDALTGALTAQAVPTYSTGLAPYPLGDQCAAVTSP